MGRKTMLIYVTEDDIKKGQRKSSISCPIARSLKRRGFDVAVSLSTVTFHSPFVRVDLPQEAQFFVRNFDAGVRRDRLRPFRFRLEVPKGAR